MMAPVSSCCALLLAACSVLTVLASARARSLVRGNARNVAVSDDNSDNCHLTVDHRRLDLDLAAGDAVAATPSRWQTGDFGRAPVSQPWYQCDEIDTTLTDVVLLDVMLLNERCQPWDVEFGKLGLSVIIDWEVFGGRQKSSRERNEPVASIACAGWLGNGGTSLLHKYTDMLGDDSDPDSVFKVLLTYPKNPGGRSSVEPLANLLQTSRLWLTVGHASKSMNASTALVTSVPLSSILQHTGSDTVLPSGGAVGSTPKVICRSYSEVGDMKASRCTMNVTMNASTLFAETTPKQEGQDLSEMRLSSDNTRVLCIPPCRKGSQCVDTGVCSCLAGFTGPLCDVPSHPSPGQCGYGNQNLTPGTAIGHHYPTGPISPEQRLCQADPAYHSKSTVHTEVSISVVSQSCRPVPSALVDVWQADTGGEYIPLCAASFHTDKAGQIMLYSVNPGSNGGLPRTLHLLVHNASSTAASASDSDVHLATQTYFMGDPLRDTAAHKCSGPVCHAADPRLSMTCVHWGSLEQLKCSFVLVLQDEH